MEVGMMERGSDALERALGGVALASGSSHKTRPELVR